MDTINRPPTGPNSPHWRAFTAECTLAADQIGVGARSLSQLQPASIGSFYVALFPLSIGYERMAKVALQINAKITTGQFLTKAQMRDKATAGHRIDALFDRVEELAVTHKYDQNHPNGQRPTDDITMAITAVLTEFADGGRYNHLNSLGSPDAPVPSAEEQWDSEVMRRIAATHLTARRKSKIARNAAMWDIPGNPDMGTLAFHQDVDGSFHTTPGMLALRAGIYEALTPYARMYALRPGRWLASILDQLTTDAMGSKHARGHVPYVNEFFGWLDNNDAFLRQRRDLTRNV